MLHFLSTMKGGHVYEFRIKGVCTSINRVFMDALLKRILVTDCPFFIVNPFSFCGCLGNLQPLSYMQYIQDTGGHHSVTTYTDKIIMA